MQNIIPSCSTALEWLVAVNKCLLLGNVLQYQPARWKKPSSDFLFTETTGEYQYAILKKLEKYGLDIQNCLGQGGLI